MWQARDLPEATRRTSVLSDQVDCTLVGAPMVTAALNRQPRQAMHLQKASSKLLCGASVGGTPGGGVGSRGPPVRMLLQRAEG